MKKVSLTLLCTLASAINFTYAQAPKIKSLSEMDGAVKEGASTGIKIVMYIVGFVLAVGVIYTIYAWISNNQNKAQYLIGFGVGTLVWIIAYNYIIGF